MKIRRKLPKYDLSTDDLLVEDLSYGEYDYVDGEDCKIEAEEDDCFRRQEGQDFSETAADDSESHHDSLVLESTKSSKKTYVKQCKVPVTTTSISHTPRKKYEVPSLKATELTFVLSDDTVLHIAMFLPLNSVSSLSCCNKFLNSILASEFLYCAENGTKTSHHLLPCARALPRLLPPAEPRPKGVARKFAIESQLYSTKNRPDFKLVDLIPSHGSASVQNLSLKPDSLSFTTTDCSIRTNTFTPQHKQKSLMLKGYEKLICSAFSHQQNHHLCATLGAISSDSQKSLLLSLTKLSSQTYHSGKVQWQVPILTASDSVSNPQIQFDCDDDKILLNTNRPSVFDSKSGKELWSSNCDLRACTIHKDLVIGVQGYKSTLKIFDVRQQQRYEPIVNANLQSNHFIHWKKIFVFNGRIWMTQSHGVMCTNKIYGRLRNSTSYPVTHSLPMNIVAKTAHSPSISCHEDHIYIADASTIHSYDKRNLRSPFQTIQLKDMIQDMIVDDTKIIYSTDNNLKILPIDAYMRHTIRIEPVSIPSKYLPKSASIRCFHQRGNLLAISYQYKDMLSWNSGMMGGDARFNGEVRVFDIQNDDCDVVIENGGEMKKSYQKAQVHYGKVHEQLAKDVERRYLTQTSM